MRGTYPNIEVDLQVIYKTSFLFRPIHVKEEYKPMRDKEMQRLVYLGISKKDMLPYSLSSAYRQEDLTFEEIYYRY